MSRTTISRSAAFIFLLLFLTGCKLVVSPGNGGTVESVSGNYFCASGDTCTYDILDTDFDEEFVAVPDDGYEFLAWKKGPRYFCGLNTDACALTTTGFGDYPSLLTVLRSNERFYLEPVFTSKATFAYAEGDFSSVAFVLSREIAIVMEADTTGGGFIPLNAWYFLPDGSSYEWSVTRGYIEVNSASPRVPPIASNMFMRDLIRSAPPRITSSTLSTFSKVQQASSGGIDLSFDCANSNSIQRNWDDLAIAGYNLLKENAITVIGAASVISHLSCDESKEKFVRDEATDFAMDLGEKLGIDENILDTVSKLDEIERELTKPPGDNTTLTVDAVVNCTDSGTIAVTSCTRDLFNIADRAANWIQDLFVTDDVTVIREVDVTIENIEAPECTANVNNLLEKTFSNGTSGIAPFDLRVSVDTNTYCDRGASSSWTLRKSGSASKSWTGLSFTRVLREAGTYQLEHTVRSNGKIIASDTTSIKVSSPSNSDDIVGIWTWSGDCDGDCYPAQVWLIIERAGNGYRSFGQQLTDLPPGDEREEEYCDEPSFFDSAENAEAAWVRSGNTLTLVDKEDDSVIVVATLVDSYPDFGCGF